MVANYKALGVDYLAVYNPLFHHLAKMSKNGKNHPEHIMFKLLVGISSYFFVGFFVRVQMQMMCLVWQFSLVHLTLILSQLKIGRVHEHDDISKNVSNFSFQNFVWAAGRCFLLIYFAFWKHRIFTLLTTLISFNKGKRGLTAFQISITSFAINLEIPKQERWG